MSDKSWRDEFRDPVRALGRRCLADRNNDSIVIGAYVIQCIGTSDDAPDLMRAVRNGLNNALRDKPETNIYPRPRGAIQELIRATEALTDRGMKIAAEPAAPEDICVYLAALCRKPEGKERSPYWEKNIVAWMGDANPIIRKYAVQSLPKQLPENLQKPVVERMQDSDPDVQTSACKVATSNPCEAFKEPALSLLSKNGDDWVRREAFSVAVACNARYEALQIAADRIDESKSYEGISWLISGCIKSGSYGTSCTSPSAQQIAGVRDRWKAFLKKHEQEIRGNTFFKPGGAELDANLFPGVTFHLPDRSVWPKP